MTIFKCSVCGKEEWLFDDGQDTAECLTCGAEMYQVNEE